MFRRFKRVMTALSKMVPWRRVVFCMGLIAAGCAPAPVSAPPGPLALAVWTLEDLSLPGAAPADLADLLAARVMETVAANHAYPLVEREKLLPILEELNLGSSQLTDAATGLRIGRLAGARLMLFGAYQVVGSLMRLDLRLVAVETGMVTQAVQKTVPAGDLSAWLQGAADATQELLSGR